MKQDRKEKPAKKPVNRKRIALLGLGAAASVILTWLWIAAE